MSTYSGHIEGLTWRPNKKFVLFLFLTSFFLFFLPSFFNFIHLILPLDFMSSSNSFIPNSGHGSLNQFGKARAGLEDEIDKVNESRADQAEAEDLLKYKKKFLEIDADGSGDLDAFELLNFLNGVGLKDDGRAWTEPKIKEKVISKYGQAGKMRYPCHALRHCRRFFLPFFLSFALFSRFRFS
jgi:hypothetical protein